MARLLALGTVSAVLQFRLLFANSAPIIDMAQWQLDDDILRDEVARQVAIAARDFGFFFVRNHGIASGIASAADRAMQEFFALPQQAKEDIFADKKRALKTARGYAGLREEQLDMSHTGRPDLKEVLDIGLPLGNSTETYLGPNLWPKAMPTLQAATEPYLKAGLRTGMQLLSVVARSLGLPDDSFDEMFDEPLVVQRLMHYPAQANLSDVDSAEIGCGAHYDFGGLTLLRQSDMPGLEVQPPSRLSGGPFQEVFAGPYSTINGTFYSDLRNHHDNQWLTVDADPDLLVVTFGEAMQRLTNDRVQATRHRVVHNGKGARHSMAIFVDPNPHREVSPLPTLAMGSPKYLPRMAGHKTVLLAGAIRGYLGFGKV